MILSIIIAYLGVVLTIGLFSHRLFRRTGEDYFVATRNIGSFVLFMSLFGTNMTAFTIIGASGEAYHHGIGVFALMASSSALVIPAVFLFVGTRAWAIGKRHGYLTQIQFFRDRWNSNLLAILLFVALNALLIPYLLIGVMGGGITLNQITSGAIPEWAGGLGVCLVVLIYVLWGGMRGTAWVNTFQTLVFMVCGGLAFVVIVRNMGGLENAMQAVSIRRPELLMRGDLIKPLQLLTYMCIPLSAGMFPHLFIHWLTARNARAFKQSVVLYPISIALVWIPSVLLGVLAIVDFPDLKGPAANSVIIRMIELHASTFLAGVLAAGVISAVMNSLDSQVLAIGNMFTHDVVGHYAFQGKLTEKQQVLFGRLFVLLIIAITYVLSLISNRSIFRLGIWCFTGFASLFPILVAALFWKRSNKYGAIASVISVAILWIYFFHKAGNSPDYTVAETGIMPVGVMLVVSTIAMIVVSYLTPAPEAAMVDRFFTEPQSLEKPQLTVIRGVGSPARAQK